MYKESIYMIYDKRLKYITYNKRCTAGTSIGERLTTAFTECSPALMRWGGGGGHWILFLFWYSVFCVLPIFVNFHFFYDLRSGRRWRGSSSLAVMTSATGIDIIWKPWWIIFSIKKNSIYCHWDLFLHFCLAATRRSWPGWKRSMLASSRSVGKGVKKRIF